MPASTTRRPYAGTGGRPIPHPVLSCSTRQKRAGQPWRHHDACQGGMLASAAPGESLSFALTDPATKSGTALGLQQPKNASHRAGAGKKRPEAPRPIPVASPEAMAVPPVGQETARKPHAAGGHTGNRMAGRRGPGQHEPQPFDRSGAVACCAHAGRAGLAAPRHAQWRALSGRPAAGNKAGGAKRPIARRAGKRA